MDKLMVFLDYTAWTGIILFSALIVLRVFTWYLYMQSDRAQMRDLLDGIERTFPIVSPTIVIIVCALWLIA